MNTLTAAHLEYGRKNAQAQNAAIDRGDDQAELKSVMDALAKRDAEIKSFAEKASASALPYFNAAAEVSLKSTGTQMLCNLIDMAGAGRRSWAPKIRRFILSQGRAQLIRRK